MKNIPPLIIVVTFLINFLNCSAQEVEMKFLILKSTKNYASALKTAKEASNKLGLKLDLRNYFYDKEEGLATDSLCECGENHGYIPRGRFDDGEYISIEFSDYYEGFNEGYYIVIAKAFNDEDEETKTVFKEVKQHFPDAYIKNSMVYVGCMH